MTVEYPLYIMTTEYNLDQLNDIGSDVNLSEVPPINQKRMLAFINEFLINTISLLNDFYQNCESRLQKFDLKMQKLEAELCILESKLKSIPGLDVDIPKPVVAAETPQPQTEIVAPNVNLEINVMSEPSNDVGDESDTPVEPQSKSANPELEKYYRMLRFGVPMEAVKVEMQIDGCDPKLLDGT